MAASKIFQSYRALGFVSNDVPLILRYIKVRKEHLIITVVDRCFHTYGSDHLKLLSISNPLDYEISCLAGDERYVFTATDRVISAWRRGTELEHQYTGHKSPVHLLLPFAAHLLSVDQSNTLKMFDVKTEECIIDMGMDINTFKISTLIHPSTYLNKILLGSEQGSLQLWNIRTITLIYTFKGWDSSVLVLEQAPSLDVVAIGLASGDIYLHNLKFDETILKFTQEWGPVTGISFRTDNTPQMASASAAGHIAIWDLEKRKLHSQIFNAHRAAVTGLKFLASEPCLVTSSSDNSLKVWIFDQSDGSARLLKLKEGHSSAPTKIRFHGVSGKSILSAGLDGTLRSFSTRGDNLNKNLGQGSYSRKIAKKKGILNDPLKLPPITDFTSDATREKEWDSIAACHRAQNMVTTWSFDKCRMGDHKLKSQNQSQQNVALCITLSPCGNFVIIGYSKGDVEKYNIQSGIFRGRYGDKRAHNGSVRGVTIDGLCQLVVTGGSDKRIAFWHFKTCNNVDELTLDSPVSALILHRESGMIAVAQDNANVLIIDLETRKIARIFSEHYATINDMAFSPDSRWIIVATMDKLLRTWDLPTGRLIDAFLVPSACTSLTFSPIGDFLATTHVDNVGVYLWCNTTLYSHVALSPLPNDFMPKIADLPLVTIEGGSSVAQDSQLEIFEEAIDEFQSPDQISDDLVTLSLLPHSHWHNLLNLDIIKKRNQVIKPNQTTEKAPFFLPTIAGLTPKFDVKDDKENSESTSKLKFSSTSTFGELLIFCGEENDFSPVLLKLKEMGPSMIDVELRTLSPDCGGSEELMEYFLSAIDFGLGRCVDFELVQAYLALFLKLHADTISSSVNLCFQLQKIQERQAEMWLKLHKKINQSICLVNYFRSAVI